MRIPDKLLATLLGLLCTGPLIAGAEVKIEEKIVGPAFSPGVVYTLSPKGMHVATMHGRDGKTLVTLDGAEGPMLDRILDAAAGGIVMKVSEDGYYTRVPQKWTGPVAFSPNGERHAYAGQIGQESVVFLDGKEIHRGPLAKNGPAVENLRFSPDSKHLFFHIRTTNSFQSFQLMMDGGPVSPPFETAAMPFFSKDGSRWGLLAGKPKTPNQKFLIIDGKDAGYNLIHYRPVFAETGNAFFYTAGFMMGRLSLHCNDHIEPECLGISNTTLSPDGKRWVYYSKRADNTTRLIENGKETGPSAMVQGGPVLFSADSKHMVAPLHQAYWCDDRRIVSAAAPLGFTPDSQHLILKGRDSTKDGVTLNTYYVNGDLVAKFSARGSTWAGIGIPKAWEQQPDGTIVFVGPDIGVTYGLGPIKRITVTPDPTRNYVAWLANSK